ncbi:MAG: hypothetical protein WBF42_07325 [Terracidiphilus sp.]
MADLGSAEPPANSAGGSGVFSSLAWVQYAALARMRSRLFVNGIRTNEGAFEFGARAVSFFIYCLIGLSLGAGAGAATFAILSSHEWQFLAIEFWVVLFLWQAMSVMLASFQEQFDLTGLLRFPVSFGSFVLLHLIFGLIDIPTIVGGLCVLGILVATTIARPELFVWAALVLGCFAAFNALLARAILAWLDRWLAKRRSREIMSAVFLLGVLSLQAFNPGLHKQSEDGRPAAEAHRSQRLTLRAINAARAVQVWLPGGLSAEALQHAEENNPVAALGLLGLLGVYSVGAGAMLALRLKAEYRSESLGEAPNRQRAAVRESGWGLRGGPIAAVIEKELRTLTRSIPQLYAVFVPMVMVFIIGNVFRTAATNTRHPFQLAFPLCVAYGLVGFIQLIYNNLGAEGSGIQLLLLSPTPMRTVLLAKNLCHAGLFLMVAAGSGLLASIRLGRPGPVIAVVTVAWIAFALPANLAAGDLMSLMMPYRVNLGRLGRQRGSQANALLSMMIQAGLLGIGAGVISLCSFLGGRWSAAIVLLVLAAAAWVVWLVVLSKTDRIAGSRKENLIARLVKTE